MTIAQNENTTPALDIIVWGADAIAPHLGRTVKGAYGALEGGRVPGAKKIAGRWALNLRIFHATFETAAASKPSMQEVSARKFVMTR